MAKPIITLNGLKIVIMLGMLVVILSGIRFAADIIVPFILALFIAVVLNPVVQRMTRCRIPRVIAVSLLIVIIVMLMERYQARVELPPCPPPDGSSSAAVFQAAVEPPAA
ncbi:AI-2E family transporter [Salmonella enterica subsp. enterica serovar Bareilly]|nr:AI-2E family transporter [Salmonella enterica subsp. enterica serovar Bareilly]